MRRLGALLVSVLSTMGLLGLTPTASAASMNMFLNADGRPSATMSLQAPGPGSPMIVTLKPSAAGAAETDPTKYQRWEYDMSGMTATVNTVTLWVDSLNPNGERPFAFSVFVMDCFQSCTVLNTGTKTLQGNQTWTKVNLSVKTGPLQFGAGHDLVVKVVVQEGSAGDVAFAFGTSEFASVLHLSALAPTPTTTTTTAPTTTTTTTPTTTTTTSTTTTTTTIPQATTTTVPQATTTTVPRATTTTSPAAAPPTTTVTTTTVPSSTTTTEQVEAVAPPLPPTSGGKPLDFGDSQAMPEMITLTGSIDAPGTEVADSEAVHQTSLRPAEGLAVMFASASDTFVLYWEIAVALGVIMSLLLMIGFAHLEIPRPNTDTSERIRRIG